MKKLNISFSKVNWYVFWFMLCVSILNLLSFFDYLFKNNSFKFKTGDIAIQKEYNRKLWIQDREWKKMYWVIAFEDTRNLFLIEEEDLDKY